VAGLVVPDSEPLGLASRARGKPDADACRDWLLRLETAGVRILVPEIVDYEVRRELVRVGATAGLRRLDNLLGRFPLLALDRAALLRAAELWALVRRAGLPTAHPHALDVDAVLAGQALNAVGPGNIATVATSNPRHLARFPRIGTGTIVPPSLCFQLERTGRSAIRRISRDDGDDIAPPRAHCRNNASLGSRFVCSSRPDPGDIQHDRSGGAGYPRPVSCATAKSVPSDE
jgi:predicted nucleic acid-binding protein